MQFGIFTVSDITQDPTTGRTPTEAERIKAVLAIAQKAEEVGLDVFALGEHHNPPFFSSSPTTTLGWIAAQTSTLTSRVRSGSGPPSCWWRKNGPNTVVTNRLRCPARFLRPAC